MQGKWARLLSKPRVTIVVLGLLTVLLSACATDRTVVTADPAAAARAEIERRTEEAQQQRERDERIRAFDFPVYLEWLNVERPIRMDELRGKFVVLDFWTYGCINCYHTVPKLNRLQAEFSDELVVIGVHSAKYPTASFTENIRQAVDRYNMRYPVVNDAQMFVWGRYRIEAWPSLVLIDPEGYIVGAHAGEWPYDRMEQLMKGLIDEYEQRGSLDRYPLPANLRPKDRRSDTLLRYPEELYADPENNRLFVSDTGNHRIIELERSTGLIRRVFGHGRAAHADGVGEQAAFWWPKGMARIGRTLYVADTGNHAIRSIDLETGRVTTVYDSSPDDPGGLRSPWDVAADPQGGLLVAVAGEHQIWRIDTETGDREIVAGTGVEGVRNGAALEAHLAQPSGLSAAGMRVFFADSESSGVRVLRLGSDSATVESLIGRNLFYYGDGSGPLESAVLTHPKDVAAVGNDVYVSDTYNNKIKRISLSEGRLYDFAGSEAGYADGAVAAFDEPHGISHAAGDLYVADTNNHLIRRIDLESGETATFRIANPDRLSATQPPVEKRQLPERRIGPRDGAARVDVILPDGFILNEGLAHSATMRFRGYRGRSAVGSALPTTVAIEPSERPSAEFRMPPVTKPVEMIVELNLYYCRKTNTDLCYFETVELIQPLTPDGDAASTVEIAYEVNEPDSAAGSLPGFDELQL